MKQVLLAWLALLLSGATWAHKGSDAYLQLNDQPRLSFSYAVALKDLELALRVDANGDGQVTWGEVKAALPAIQALLASNIGLVDAPALDWQYDGLEARGDGAYLRLKAWPQTSAGAALALRYSLFRSQDATHRLLVAGRLDGQDLLLTLAPTEAQATRLRVAAPEPASTGMDTPAQATEPHATWRSLTQYFLLGVHHLLEGYDHLAFLLALVLPLQLRLWPRRAAVRVSGVPAVFSLPMPMPMPALPAPAASQSRVWMRLLRTVTAFTVGHSITLILATLGYTSASAAWVEPAIAVSIGVSALLNIYPCNWLRTELLAGAFGLVHGYGFAGLLTEAAAPSGLLGWALCGFNLGVEGGQLIAVSGWLIVSQPWVGRPLYERWVLRRGSWLLVLLATFWFLERVR